MVELLAPAGSPEAVTAAVQSGANAVYLSFEDLTGCRRTENIPNSEFESVVRYCRIRGCRAYLALNIPVREDELNKAAGLALRAQRCGVDAIIVRDLGLFRILRSLLPEMPLLVPLWRLHSCILWCFRLYIFLIFIFMHHFFSCLRSAILMSRSATLSCSVISTLESGSALYRILVLPPLMNFGCSTTLKLKVRINHTIKVNFICD